MVHPIIGKPAKGLIFLSLIRLDPDRAGITAMTDIQIFIDEPNLTHLLATSTPIMKNIHEKRHEISTLIVYI